MNRWRNNIQAEVLPELIRLRLDEGQKWADVLEATGLSHSKAEGAVMEQQMENAGMEPVELTGEFVQYCRSELKIGWGPIAVWCQTSEGAVRDAFEKTVNQYSECQRVGHGGRWKFNEPSLYAGELQPTGTVVETSVSLNRPTAIGNAVDQSTTKKLQAKDVKELRELATKAGVTFTKNSTKAQLVIKLRKFIAEQAMARQAS